MMAIRTDPSYYNQGTYLLPFAIDLSGTKMIEDDDGFW